MRSFARPGLVGTALVIAMTLVVSVPAEAQTARERYQSAIERDEKLPKRALAGAVWLLDLQNRDGGIPTFCKGWGTLPFDRSNPDITAHAIRAWLAWFDLADANLQFRMRKSILRAMGFLKRRTERAVCYWLGLLRPRRHG